MYVIKSGDGKKWYGDKYQEAVCAAIADKLNKEERQWLKEVIKEI